MYMKLRSILGVATVACALTGLSVSNVSASSVTFDDVAGGALPSNYGGLSWDPNASVYDVTNYNNGYSNSVSFPSNPNAVYNGHGVQTFNVTSPLSYYAGRRMVHWLGGAITRLNLIHRLRCLLRVSSAGIP